MGRPAGWMKALTGRSPMKSPGKPELMARRPKQAKLVENERLHEYVQERLSGQVRRSDGVPLAGPVTAEWKGRNKPHRQDRRWAQAWSPEQISNRLKVDFPDD